jgi:hypothetical protein
MFHQVKFEIVFREASPPIKIDLFSRLFRISSLASTQISRCKMMFSQLDLSLLKDKLRYFKLKYIFIFFQLAACLTLDDKSNRRKQVKEDISEQIFVKKALSVNRGNFFHRFQIC